MVGVGTAIARRPLHRSRRAELPHRAPASGDDAKPDRWVSFAYPLERIARVHAGSVSGSRFAQAAFPLASSLPSTTSATFCVPQLRRYYEAVRLPTTVHLWRVPHGVPSAVCSTAQTVVGSPGFRVKCIRTCSGSPTARSLLVPRDRGTFSFAFRLVRGRRHSELPARAGTHFRSSIPGLHVPLSTLHLRSYPRLCMTRSRCGSLLLHRIEFSSTTLHRLLPAHRTLREPQMVA